MCCVIVCFCVCVCAVAAAAAAQALHLANQSPQQMYSALAHTPPSMTPGPNPQSPQASFPPGQQTVYIHQQQVPHGYNPGHMAHVQQVVHKDLQKLSLPVRGVIFGLRVTLEVRS